MAEKELTETELLHQVIQDTFGDGAVLTSFLIVTEWMEPSDEYSFDTFTDDHTPPWKRKGMLQEALDDLRSDD